MKRKILAVITTICMVTMLSLPVFATPADSPQDTPIGARIARCGTCTPCMDGDLDEAEKLAGCENETLAANPSTGESTAVNNGSGWSNDGDDTNQGGRNFNGADISVWAKVVQQGADTKIYCVDIEWGNMQFVFTRALGTWDPDSLTYNVAASEEWDDFWIDGDNNKVRVVNRSNDDIDADFDFNFEGGTDNLFNATGVSADRVQGNFFDDNAGAIAAALLLSDAEMAGISAIPSFVDDVVKVESADNDLGADPGQGAEKETEVFFAFSGKPTKDILVEDYFQKVGVITVTITPHVAP